MSVVLALCVGVLVACGVYLVLHRTLTRIVIGLGLLGHGVNLLLVAAGGRAGAPAFVGQDGTADPLAQALVLTAIVIGFGMTGLVLTLAYRSWQLNRHDDAEDDIEDRRIAERRLPGAEDEADVADELAEDAGEVRP